MSLAASRAVGPHRFVVDRPVWCACLALASLLLSYWAIHLDPVINADGAGELRAAQLFAAGRWLDGLNAGDQPFYSALVALLGRLMGMSPGYSAYALNAFLFALLVVGFAVLVDTLGATLAGGRPAPWTAAVVVLLFPSLNGFRPFVTGDVGYWACYVWGLAWFMHHAAAPGRRSFAMWALATSAALLFRLEALVFLVVVPLWWLAERDGAARARLWKALVVIVALGVVAVYALWRHAWQSPTPAGGLLHHPLDHLAASARDAEEALRFKLLGLRSVFLDRYSRHYDAVALLTTLALLSASAVVKALGVLYAALAGYAWLNLRNMLRAAVRHWWGVFVVLSLTLLMVPAFTEFSVARRGAMTAALTIAAAVPFALERLRRLGAEHGGRRWALPAALLLVLAVGIAGLDLPGGRTELREAGLWLRATAEPGSRLYSNSPIVVYYSGLDGYRPDSGYTWQQAMRTVWTGRWRRYDYLAVAIPGSKAYRVQILMRKMDSSPARTFTGADGGRVLVFKARRDRG